MGGGDGFLGYQKNSLEFESRDSWMYPYQRTPMGDPYKSYIVGIYGL